MYLNRTRRILIIVAVTAATALCMLPMAATAQPAVPVEPSPETVDWLTTLMDSLVKQAPWAMAVLSLIGLMRTIFKPVMTIAEAVVKWTKTDRDDQLLAKFEAGPVYRWMIWVLDWLGSIRPPTAKSTNPLLK